MLNLREKVITAFVSGGVIFLISGLISFWIGRKVVDTTKDFDDLLKIEGNLREVKKIVDEATKFNMRDRLKDAQPFVSDIVTTLSVLEKLGFNTGDFSSLLMEYFKTVGGALDVGLTYESIAEISGKAKKLKESFAALRAEHSKKIERLATGSALITLLVAVSVSIVFSLFGFFFSSRIVSSIKAVSDFLKKLSAGGADISKKISVSSRDEIGQLSESFNSFLDSLSSLVKEIYSVSTSLASAAHEAYAVIEEIFSGFQKQSQEVARISTSAEELSATISETVKNVREVSNFSETAFQSANSSGEIIFSSLSGIYQVQEKMKELVRATKVVSDSSRNIANLTGDIMDITDQTNLLALNASIEAARAGDYGKGFRVVAEEVRKLSNRTGQIAQNITKMVKDFSSSADAVASSIDEISKIVVQRADEAKKGTEAISSISENFKKTKNEIMYVASAASQQEKVTYEVSESVTKVAQFIESSNRSLESMREMSKNLSILSEKLSDLIRNFKI